MERIHAFARGQSWNEEGEVAGDAGSEEDDSPDRDSDSDFDEEMGQHSAPGPGRKRRRAAGAKAAPGDEKDRNPNKRRRGEVREVEPSAHAVQRLPLGAVKQIGIALDYDTKLALSSTCHLARETLFNSRMMDEDWIRAYARKRQGERTIQRDGSKAFALQSRDMQRSCRFEERYVRYGRYKYLYNVPDLFKCAFETHGGWKGFIAALEQRKRRSDAQYRALELRPIKTAIQGLIYRLTLLPAELQTTCAAVLHELNALMGVIRTGDVHDVRKVLRERSDKVARLEFAARLLELHDNERELMRYPAGFGVSEGERDSLLERLGQLRQQCESATTIEALPPTADMEQVRTEVFRMESRVKLAYSEVERIQSMVHNFRKSLSAVPDELKAISTIVLQEVDSLQGAISICAEEGVPHLRKVANECSGKVAHLEAAARLLNPRGIRLKLLPYPVASAMHKGERDSYLDRLDQLRQQCESATTMEALPAKTDVDQIEAEGREMVGKARQFASRGVKAFLAERQRIESQWTEPERDDFIRRELARFGVQSQASQPFLGGIFPDFSWRNRLVEQYTRKVPVKEALSSEIVIGILGATDDAEHRGGLHFMPSDLHELIQRRVEQELAPGVTSQSLELWQPTRDEFIQRFIQEGLRLRAECSVKRMVGNQGIKNEAPVEVLKGIGGGKGATLRNAGIATIGELVALPDNRIPALAVRVCCAWSR